VRTHLENIYERLGVSSRTAAVTHAFHDQTVYGSRAGPPQADCELFTCHHRGGAPYSAEVQQSSLPRASSHDRQRTELAGMTAKRPAAPLVRDEEAVPAACLIGRSTLGAHVHSWATRHTGTLADR
jgi:hypothetical protein